MIGAYYALYNGQSKTCVLIGAYYALYNGQSKTRVIDWCFDSWTE